VHLDTYHLLAFDVCGQKTPIFNEQPYADRAQRMNFDGNTSI